MRRSFLSVSALLLTMAMFSGCADDVTPSTCGNGQLDEGEVCDGNSFAPNKNKCPDGQTGVVVCSASCEVSTSACKPAVVGECTGNEEKCVDDLIHICQNGHYSPTQTPCGSTPVTNKEGDTACEGNNYMLFTGGTWTTKEDCATSGKTCDATKGCVGETPKPDCTPQAKQCSDGKYMECLPAGKWAIKDNCSALGKICDENQGCIEDPTVEICQDGDDTCAGFQWMKCSGGDWSVVEDCAETGKSCVKAKGCVETSTVVCAEEAKNCDDDVYKVCKDNAWVTQEDCKTASKTCTLSEGCITESDCTNDAVSCIDNVLKICENGKWKETDCSLTNAVCSENEKTCVVYIPPCTENTYKCSDKTLSVCTDGQWVETTCNEGETCNADVGKCLKEALCKDGDARCNDNTYGVCIGGEWLEEECGEKSCKVEGNGCVKGEAECVDGQAKCSEDGKYYLCIQGEWLFDDCKALGRDCSVEAGGCKKYGDLCVDGAGRCIDNTPGVCVDGYAWLDDDEPCADGSTCDPVSASCVKEAVCDDNKDQPKCLLNSVVVCNGGQWEVFENCSDISDWSSTQGGYFNYVCDPSDLDDPKCVESLCGNGTLEAAERCDGANIGSSTCKDFNKYIVWDASGKPGCSNCSLTQGTCKEAVKTTLKRWEFTKKNSINQEGISLHGGFDTSAYLSASQAWNLGYWGDSKTVPDFNGKYIQFVVGDVSSYTNVWVSFDFSKNNSGPKKVIVGFFDGDKLLDKSSVLIPTGKLTNSGQLYIGNAIGSKNLSFRIAGYDSPEKTSGSLQIANVQVTVQ